MSWRKTHRTTSIYQAVLASLFSMASLNAYAVNLGQANIQSAQHEPLKATINVTGIDAANFHASIASSDIYHQMGLNPNAQITAKFTPTSANAGQITLTSNAPISTPFADVVLNLDNNGKQVIEPQTLLMPLPATNAFSLPEGKITQVVTTENTPNLPEVSPLTTEPEVAAQPVQPVVANDVELAQSTQVVDTSTPVLTPVPTATESSEGNVLSTQTTVLARITPEGTNRQVDILTKQITQRVYPAGQAPSMDVPSATEMTANTETLPQTTDKVTPPTDTQAQTGEAVYIVQQGDSLWSIANEIAKANNMSVSEVMNAIHTTNPDAFHRGNINQLKANANLNLPNYQVIPSQKAISEAIAAKQSRTKQTNTANNRKANNQTTAKSTTPARRGSQVTTKPTRTALPRAQMTLVTPAQQGGATGTSSKPTQRGATGGADALTTKLQNTRQQTANNARRVNNLNAELSSAAKKVQLQNQRLAELEKRLKALKENQ